MMGVDVVTTIRKMGRGCGDYHPWMSDGSCDSHPAMDDENGDSDM